MHEKSDLLSIYKQLGRLEVRHPILLKLFKKYAQPNKKIHSMIQQGELIAVSRGFYLLSPEKLNRSYFPEVIANLLYGPSYISLESAMAHYGLIPERVANTTSVTTRRPKTFETPIGAFSYEHLIQMKYPLGIRQVRASDQSRYLIASPSKALMDYLTFRYKKASFRSVSETRRFIEEDLRFDLDRYRTADPRSATIANLKKLARAYSRNPSHIKLIQFLLNKLE